MIGQSFMKKAKGFSGVLLLGMTIVVSSCSDDDILDKDPVTEIVADTAFNTEGDVLASLNSAYAPLQWQNVNGNQTFPLMQQGVRADDLHSQSANFWAIGADYDGFSTIVPSTASVASVWSKWYQGVARANFAKQLAENFENFETDGLREQIIAEAQFLRGFYYFELVRLFGRIPIFDEPITSSDQEQFKKQSEIEEVYEFIIEDLEAASNVLPTKGSQRDASTATSGAALALLAKVYLYQKDWTSVVTTTQRVIDQGIYSLENDFGANFVQTNEFGVESVFEINFVDGISAVDFNAVNQVQQGSGMWKWSFPFLQGYNSFNNFIPRQSLVDFFDDSDQRKQATFVFPGEDLSPGLTALGNAWQTWNYGVGFDAGCQKYFLTFEEKAALLTEFQSPLNEKVIRYAEVLLMYVEASLMGGGGTNGQTYFQQLVDRAYGSNNTTVAPPYTLQGLKDERRRELATEGWNRFTDLVRWGDAQAALSLVGKNFQVGRDEYLPIPQQEIDTYPEGMLEQNPGY